MKDIRRPRISVIMPVYNGAQYLSESISSILGQSFGDFEFIVVDDGSTDASGAIVHEFARRDHRIVAHQQKNAGVAAALNTGLGLAGGEFIARMDADDVTLPDRFEAQVTFLDANPEHVAVGSRTLLVDPDGAPLLEMNHETSHEEIEAAHLDGSRGSVICHPTVMMRADAVRSVGGYRREFESAEDLDLFLRLGEIGRLANLPTVLLKYRQHMGSIGHCRSLKQQQTCQRACAEARSRRGMPAAAEVKARGPESLSFSEQSRKWAWWALGAGYVRTARKHALAALRRTPWSLDAWRVMACALRGH